MLKSILKKQLILMSITSPKTLILWLLMQMKVQKNQSRKKKQPMQINLIAIITLCLTLYLVPLSIKNELKTPRLKRNQARKSLGHLCLTYQVRILKVIAIIANHCHLFVLKLTLAMLVLMKMTCMNRLKVCCLYILKNQHLKNRKYFKKQWKLK